MAGIAWLLDRNEKALEKIGQRFDWKSRRVMRAESKEEKATKKKEAARPVMAVMKRANDIIFDGEIPRVSMIKLVKFVEYMAEEAAREGNPSLMGSWLCNLAGVDGAIRARKARQIERIKRDSIKIYLPEQDPIPAMDVEEAQIVPPPVVF